MRNFGRHIQGREVKDISLYNQSCSVNRFTESDVVVSFWHSLYIISGSSARPGRYLKMKKRRETRPLNCFLVPPPHHNAPSSFTSSEGGLLFLPAVGLIYPLEWPKDNNNLVFCEKQRFSYLTFKLREFLGVIISLFFISVYWGLKMDSTINVAYKSIKRDLAGQKEGWLHKKNVYGQAKN